MCQTEIKKNVFFFGRSNCGLPARKHNISMCNCQALLLPQINNDRQIQKKKSKLLFFIKYSFTNNHSTAVTLMKVLK